MHHLTEALTHWTQYAAIRDAHFVAALYNPVGFVDMTPLAGNVPADLEIAPGWKPGSLNDDGKRGGREKGFRE